MWARPRLIRAPTDHEVQKSRQRDAADRREAREPPQRRGSSAQRRTWSLCQFAERALVCREGSLLSLLESELSIAGWPDGGNDQTLAVSRNVQLGLWCNPKQLQDGLVDDDTGAVADRL